MDGKLLLFFTTLSVVSILFLTISFIKFLNYRNRQQSNQWDKMVKRHANNCPEKKPLPLELRKQLAELNDLRGVMSYKEFEIQKQMLLDKFESRKNCQNQII